MIKIIERGTRTIVRCHECGCKFSYERMDVVNGYVQCPECRSHIADQMNFNRLPDDFVYLNCTGTAISATPSNTTITVTGTNGTFVTDKKQTVGIVDTPTIGIVEPNTAGVINND